MKQEYLDTYCKSCNGCKASDFYRKHCDAYDEIYGALDWLEDKMIEKACDIFCEMRCPSEMHFHGRRRCGKDSCNKLDFFIQAMKGE